VETKPSFLLKNAIPLIPFFNKSNLAFGFFYPTLKCSNLWKLSNRFFLIRKYPSSAANSKSASRNLSLGFKVFKTLNEMDSIIKKVTIRVTLVKKIFSF
jgi:hypothetical protein